MLGAAGLAALALAACREDERSARIAVPDPTPPALLATHDGGLPYADPATVNWHEPERGYAWAERAYGLQRAFQASPPDYAFDYGGVQPWVWETADDWAMYAEPYEDEYRYYYYEPDAAYPYFVYDGDHGYGYDAAGLLVALFDSDGDYLPYSQYDDVAPLAGRYYAHGRDLRNHAVRARHIPVTQDVWVSYAPRILATSEPWLRAAREDDGWRAWRAKSGERELKRFVKEEQRRERKAAKWAREHRSDDFGARRVASFEPPPAFREARKREAEVRREEKRSAKFEHKQAKRDEAHSRQDLRWAEAQARNAAHVEHAGGGWKPDRGGKPDHGGGKPDHRGGDKGGGDKGGKGGGKKD